MNILGALKKKHEKQKDRQLQMFLKRKQLNMTISPRIIQPVKKLAAEFAVPRYAITEHLLQIGAFYVSRAMNNRKKREFLREHLIDRHMLDSGYDDPEELLRIGEGRYASELILLAKHVISDFKILKRVLAEARRTGNLDNYEKAKRKMLDSAVTLAEWLSTHPLEEQDTEETQDEEETAVDSS